MFDRLHFVSYGSRGLEPFQLIQFISVYKWQVWVFILISTILPYFTIVKLYNDGGKSVGLFSRTFSIYKVLVEQGKPFPDNFDIKRQMRFLMVGTLLAGLVISNAFKSENMYKIVQPRAQVSYYNIDEFIEDNVIVYSRIQHFYYRTHFYLKCGFIIHPYVLKYRFQLCKDKSFWLVGRAELGELNMWTYTLRDTLKITKYSKIYPMALNSIKKTLEYLDNLFKVGIINHKSGELLERGKALQQLFFNKQQNIITNGLNNWSKTAWVMPNYLAVNSHRALKKLENILTLVVSLTPTQSLAFRFIIHMYHSQYFSRFPLFQTLVYWSGSPNL